MVGENESTFIPLGTTHRLENPGKIQLELLAGAPHNFVNVPGPYEDRALALTKGFVAQQLAGH